MVLFPSLPVRGAITACVSLSLCAAPVSAAPQTGAPVVAPSASNPYQPSDAVERGLWMEVDEAERNFKASPLIMRDPELNAYVRAVLCRVTGEEQCRNVRLYIVHTPHFNASMAPNGMMQIWSGLLLRCRNEAQLAAVLGHEYTHFEKRHGLKLFRDAKTKSNSVAWLSFVGVGLIAALGMMSSLFRYSRDMEREADAGGLTALAAAGYDSTQAAAVWEQLRAEMDATAALRNQPSRKDRDGGLFNTHPPSAERVANLREQAAREPGNPQGTGVAEYARAMARFWPEFIDDQIKMNDFGATEYLIESLSTGDAPAWLTYARGELYRRRAATGDLEKAVAMYGEAMAQSSAPAETWRGRGLALVKLGRAEEGRADLKTYLERAPDASDKAMIAMIAGGQ